MPFIGRVSMFKRKKIVLPIAIGLSFCTAAIATGGGSSGSLGEEGPNHPVTPLTHSEVVDLVNGNSRDLKTARRIGMEVFTTSFNTLDGFGDGPFDASETDSRAFGQRPTLQGNGTLLRINGLDAQSCNECHTIVSTASVPPELGIGGVGGMVQNAIIMPTMIDVADTADDRTQYAGLHDPDLPMVFDGVADFNGRFANPPFLFGGGGVEQLGREMTADLQDLLDQAQAAPAGTVFDLDTHGVNFGSITSLGGGNVQLDVEGIGFEDNSLHAPEDVLVVRPFGRKGENFTMRDFDRGAMQFHFGIQPEEVIGTGVDGDGDGLVDEVEIGELTALHVFDVTNPPPVMDRLNHAELQGFQNFQDIGCSGCHIPELQTNSRHIDLAFPDIADDPSANVYGSVDLRRVGFRSAPGGGVRVPLFADLKRHDMGPGLAETFEGGELPNEHFTTARLWGVADTAPYLHDGRATTLREAIELHGGEAQAARDGFVALSSAEQKKLIGFLMNLRTPNRPNEELVRGRKSFDLEEDAAE